MFFSCILINSLSIRNKGEQAKPKRDSSYYQSLVSSSVPSGCVELYSECNYGGTKTTVCKEVADFREIPGFNDSVASLKLAGDVSVMLFSDVNYQGQGFGGPSDNPCLPKEILKLASSIQIDPRPGCVAFYPLPNMQGQPRIHCNDVPNFDSKGVVSIDLGPGVLLYLSENPNYTQAKEPVEIKEDQEDLTKKPLKFSSFVIWPQKDCVFLYSECDGKGNKYVICDKADDVNIPTKSWKLGPDSKIAFFTDVNQTGADAQGTTASNKCKPMNYKSLDVTS
jgi:hypothetical protein